MLPNTHQNQKKCGIVTIIGEPNAGKSTLTNKLVGAKVSITSRKVQTTRVSTIGIAMWNNVQVILQDTPGIFSPSKTIEKSLVKNAWHAIKDTDLVMVIIDIKKPLEQTIQIIEKLSFLENLFIIFNKIDLKDDVDQAFYEQKIKSITSIKNIHFFWISALHNQGVEHLKKSISNNLPFQEWLYPENIITTQPEAIWACEITREELYHQLHQELPYETYVEHESFETFDNQSIKISQAIVVAKPSQKAVVIGKGGTRIKNIGQKARLTLEKEMGKTVHLKLFVKVTDNWMEKSSIRKDLGL